MKQFTPIIIMAAASLLGSCSLLNPGSKSSTVSGSSATRVDVPAGPRPGTSATETQKPATTTPPAATETDGTAAATAASARNLEGQWMIIQVGATTVDRDEDMPYIIFEPSTGRFYANNGCNTVNGDYTLDDKDIFSFGHVMMTMRYCPDVDFQHAINVVLSDSSRVQARFTEVGQESFIDLLGHGGKTAVKLRRANLDFLNGHWAVESINGATTDVPADIFFDIKEHKLHGNTGCNYFNGTIYLDHRRCNAVDFSNMGVTRMACPNTTQETAMLVALEQATTAISGGNDRVMLLDDEGHELMSLSRITE